MSEKRWLCLGIDNSDSEFDGDETDDDGDDYQRLRDPHTKQVFHPPKDRSGSVTGQSANSRGETDTAIGQRSDDDNRLRRDEPSESSRKQPPNESTQKAVYTKADKKARRISRKLKRKEKRARFLHYVRVTLKWCRRGLSATVPTMGAMFPLAPNPGAAMRSMAVYKTNEGGKSVSVFV